MRGGELPFILNNECVHDDTLICTKKRSDVISQCIPLYNTSLFEGNILDQSQQHYIHFNNNESKTYVLTDSLLLKEITNFTLPQNNESFEKSHLMKYFKNSLTIGNIPCIYLFIDPIDVFNVIISKINPISKISNDIFRISNNNFIGFSMSFNIFNVALSTHTYFKILEIFNICFNKLNSGEKLQNNFFIEKIKTIYPNKEAMCKLYDLISYKKEIVTMTNKEECRKKFLDKTFACANSDNIQKETIIISYEKHKYTDYIENMDDISYDVTKKYNDKYNNIINKLIQNIVNISLELHDYSTDMDLPDYKYMFLISILMYRLENKYVAGGWPYSVQKTLDQLNEHVNVGFLSEINDNHMGYFTNDATFPIIYDFSTINYNNSTYGNCMENVIFQMLKVLCWETNKYNIIQLRKLIKPEYYDKLLVFFANIKNEKSKIFMHDWVKFIMFEGKNIKYNLLQTDVELNPDLQNLFMAFNEIFVLKKSYTYDQVTIFFDDLISAINMNILMIDIISQPDEDKLILHSKNDKVLNIKLTHPINALPHASFKEAIVDDNVNIDIMNNISNKTTKQEIYNDLIKNKYYCASFNQWILLRIIFGNNVLTMNNKKKQYITHITKNFTNQKQYVLNRITSDANILLREQICLELAETELFYDIWHYAAKNIKSTKFWEFVATQDKFLDQWLMKYDDNDDMVWHVAVLNIKSNSFWETIATKDKYLKFWNVQNVDKNMVWHYAVINILSKKFWEIIATKQLFLNEWNIKNDYGYTTWYNAKRGILTTNAIYQLFLQIKMVECINTNLKNINRNVKKLLALNRTYYT